MLTIEPFNSNDALQLVREIQGSADDSRIGYRAFQAAQILEGIRCANKPSKRQFSDAKAAINSICKALNQI